MNSELRLRTAARAVVIDSSGRILLVRFDFPDHALWACPGGGLEQGETYEEAIRRELREEAGLEVETLGPCVWTRTHVVPIFDGWDGQVERFFLVEVDAFEARPALTPEQLAAESVTDVRWWSDEELQSSSGLFAPRTLPALVRRLRDEGIPSNPIDVGV